MILVDTSIWVGHFKGATGSAPLRHLLEQPLVLTHPFVVGELVLGGISRDVRELLQALPVAQAAAEQEVHHLVAEQGLAGRGIGWIDAHLLAAARLSAASLWSADRRLAGVAATLGVAWPPSAR